MAHTDTIIEHGYTGTVDASHIEEFCSNQFSEQEACLPQGIPEWVGFLWFERHHPNPSRSLQANLCKICR